MNQINQKSIQKAVKILSEGGIIGFPTETVYGIGVDGESEEAIKKLYKIKGRDPQKATQLLIGDVSWIDRYCKNYPRQIFLLLNKFWPGPLTVILLASNNLPSILLGSGKTVGLRVPDHPVALKLLHRFDRGIAASSANPQGFTPANNIEEIRKYFSSNVKIIVAGGLKPSGTSSTVLDVTSWPPKLIREGALPWSKMAATFLL